jgi:hypothetical protein
MLNTKAEKGLLPVKLITRRDTIVGKVLLITITDSKPFSQKTSQ